MTHLSRELENRLRRRLVKLYGKEAAPDLLRRFRMMLGRYGITAKEGSKSRWSERDTMLITYADSLQDGNKAPLSVLHQFLKEEVEEAIEIVHLLPFFPWSSDDGFSVIDYRKIDSTCGTWSDIEKLGEDFDLMFDFVLNHCSRKNQWFRDFVIGVAPARDYFVTADPDADFSEVVRPRSSELLTKTPTRNGDKWVWTTFSSDQVDLNWKNPDLLFEFLDILFLYLSKGSRFLRLDAVAFLWKKIGTDCLHLPETHEVVKLFRDVLNIVSPDSILLTETNVPHEENLSYFGKGDEAHMVYNFSLPPLVLYGYLKNDSSLLAKWADSLPTLPKGQCFLNFTASHDGIGVRPLQGLVGKEDLDWLIDQVRERDGQVSMRAMPDGSESPYELNISYMEALRVKGDEQLSTRRFLSSQALMLSMPGIPAIYIHSLLGTPNDLEGLKKLGYNRAINRKKWNLQDLKAELNKDGSAQNINFEQYQSLLKIRREESAFSPGAAFTVLSTAPGLFAFIRTCPATGTEILCLYNFLEEELDLSAQVSETIGLQIKDAHQLIASETGEGLKMIEPCGFRWLRIQKKQ